MRTLYSLCLVAAFIFAASASPAHAGVLFPPNGTIGGLPGNSCPPGFTLTWNGPAGTVECKGISTSNACANGQVMTSIVDGQPQCVDKSFVPDTTCPAGQSVVSTNKGAPVCGVVTVGNCPDGSFVSSFVNGVPKCTPATTGTGTSITSLTCPAGQFVSAIVNGTPQCSTPSAGTGGGAPATCRLDSYQYANSTMYFHINADGSNPGQALGFWQYTLGNFGQPFPLTSTVQKNSGFQDSRTGTINFNDPSSYYGTCEYYVVPQNRPYEGNSAIGCYTCNNGYWIETTIDMAN